MNMSVANQNDQDTSLDTTSDTINAETLLFLAEKKPTTAKIMLAIIEDHRNELLKQTISM